MRMRMELAYDGTPFHGWAAQPGLPTVQGLLEEALATIFRQPVAVTVAGRTDTGVHAQRQTAHFDAPGEVDERLKYRVNRLIAASGPKRAPGQAPPVVVVDISAVEADFDARFSALWREYRYLIADGEVAAPWRPDIWWRAGERLDVAAMAQAAELLVGEHDFLSFCKPRPGATTIRRILAATVTRADGLVQIDLRADAFCHSMVRSIVGVLVDIGRGRNRPDWVDELLSAPSRNPRVHIAPACGLTLRQIAYPEPGEYASQAAAARVVRTLP